MIPDAKWLDAFKLPLKAASAASVSCIALLAFNHFRVLDLRAISPFAGPFLWIVTVIASAVVFVSLVEYLATPIRERAKRHTLSTRRAVRRQEQVECREEAQKRAVAHLDYLSGAELRYVAECIRNGSPSFYTYVYSPPVTLLQGKGLVWTPSGPHNQDYYPFLFHDFAWKAILARRDEFLAQDEANEAAGRHKMR